MNNQATHGILPDVPPASDGDTSTVLPPPDGVQLPHPLPTADGGFSPKVKK